MKLSISTLGCPEWDFMKVLEVYKELGVDMEVRGIDGEMEPENIARFSAENAEETKKLLREYGVKLIGFGSGASFHNEKTQADNVETAKRGVDACVRMGIPAIRIFGNDIPDPEKWEETVDFACKGFAEVAKYAHENGVVCNLEVHGNFNSVHVMQRVMDNMAGVAGFGILWDIAHSDKTCGDDIEEFYRIIKPLLNHVHIKDHKRVNGGWELCMMGEGDIPAKKIIKMLLDDGYDGYFSLEWEKKWHPALPSGDIAFPAYVEYMKGI